MHEVSMQWLCANNLCLNVEKYCFNVFTNKNIEVIPALKIINIILSFSSETEFLGIIIDNKLIFAKHTSYLCSKTSRNIGLLKKCNIPTLEYN